MADRYGNINLTYSAEHDMVGVGAVGAEFLPLFPPEI